ncbi:MAG: hypothetical protein RI922_344 [Bacteroidota bacterium]|jgi:hypothetical protein
MREKMIFLFFILFHSSLNAQENFFTKSNSLNTKRIVITSSSIGTVWASSIIGLQQIWYSNVAKSDFHTFNDSKNWMQMDKAGHVYTANKISQLSGDLYKWSGMKRKKAAVLGSCIGLGYQTSLELLDAYSVDWGFSWADMTANTAGSLIYLGQELAWNEQRLLLKFSYHPTEFAALRPEVLGANFQERLLKDYNGQTYWLSFNPLLFTKNSKVPNWICLSIGYSANAKLVGDSDVFTSGTTIYKAKREYLLSFDVDFSRLPIKKSWLKALVKQFNYIKVPFPALILSDGKLRASGIYF